MDEASTLLKARVSGDCFLEEAEAGEKGTEVGVAGHVTAFEPPVLSTSQATWLVPVR